MYVPSRASVYSLRIGMFDVAGGPGLRLDARKV